MIAPFVDKIVTVSKSLQDAVEEKIKTAMGKIITINNGIDMNYDVDRNHLETIKEELGIKESHPVIGAVGNVKPVKGYECLIKSAAIVVEKHPNAKFIIVGDYKDNIGHKEELDQLVDKLNLKDLVVFLGYRNDINDLISLFDIYVLPSRSEGLSIALLEAMLLKKPIIATKVGGNLITLENEKTGLMVEPGDYKGMAALVEMLVANPALSERIADNAFLKARSTFSLAGMAERYESLYMSLFK